jgi:2-dehydropantoate 2-reductase
MEEIVFPSVENPGGDPPGRGIRMDDGKERMLVIGAGVNGSVCAAGLHDAGIDVTLLARGARYQELRDQGVVIENPFSGKRTLSAVPVIERLDPNDIYDYILVVVRKNQIEDLLPVLAENRSANIVFMGNNLSGPAEFVKILGRDRVMMGAVYAAGKREGAVVRAIVSRSIAAPFGEIDGSITPRLMELARIFRRAGFKAQVSSNIVDYQMTHAVGVALIAKLTLKHGCDTSALARASDELRLFVAARREAHQVMRSLGHRILPWSEALIDHVPGFLVVLGLRALLSSRLGEVGLAWHCSQAPDEMQQLAKELQELVDQADFAAPAIAGLLAPP